MTVQSDWAVLTDEQQQFFEDNGYLVIEDALPPDVVAELNAAADEIYDRGKGRWWPGENGQAQFAELHCASRCFSSVARLADHGASGVADSQLEYPDDYLAPHCFALRSRTL